MRGACFMTAQLVPASVPWWLKLVLWGVFGYFVCRALLLGFLHSGFGRALLLARIGGVSLGFRGTVFLWFRRRQAYAVVRGLVLARNVGLQLEVRDVVACMDTGVPIEDAVSQYAVAREKGLRQPFREYAREKWGREDGARAAE